MINERNSQMANDPLCRREVKEKNFYEQTEYRGRTHYFYSKDCKTRFNEDPGKYEVKVIIKKRKGQRLS